MERATKARFIFLGCMLYSFLGALVFRLYTLQWENHGHWNQLASRQHNSDVKLKGARGSIFDRNGRALAVSVQSLAVGIHPKKLKLAGPQEGELARLLSVSVKKLHETMRSKKPFVWLKRGVQAEVEPDLLALDLRGMGIFKEFKRYYPQGSLGGTLLGRVGRDGLGQSGVELSFEPMLAAGDMEIPVGRDARGRLVHPRIWEKREKILPKFSTFEVLSSAHAAPVSEESIEQVSSYSNILDSMVREEGENVKLSIDSMVQEIVEEEFTIGAENAKAAKVFGLVLDAESGEILALAQTPTLNPNLTKKINPATLRNMVLQDSFEPGSTVKPLIAASILDEGKVGENEILDCEQGRYRFGRHTIRDSHKVGKVPFSEVLVQSSNICMAKLAERVGKQGLYRTLLSYGFGRQSGIELRGEAKGILRDVKRWRHIDIATSSFGQGVAVTALQLASAYSALANGGKLAKPTILARADGDEVPHRRVLTPETADTIKEILRGVTESETGTGRQAAIQGVKVYGKTGTAQKARRDGRGYEEDKVLSSFVGFVEAEEIGVHRKLVMIVMVDEPGVMPRWGGTVAAPVFRKAMTRILTHFMGIDNLKAA